MKFPHQLMKSNSTCPYTSLENGQKIKIAYSPFDQISGDAISIWIILFISIKLLGSEKSHGFKTQIIEMLGETTFLSVTQYLEQYSPAEGNIQDLVNIMENFTITEFKCERAVSLINECSLCDIPDEDFEQLKTTLNNIRNHISLEGSCVFNGVEHIFSEDLSTSCSIFCILLNLCDFST